MATISSLRTPTRVLSAASAGRLVARAFELVAIWLQRSRERQQLQSLDDHALSDLGLSRDQVMREIEKPFWQV
jgi:uncharacterized protein YjiS (DUF1127 family)